MRQYMMMVILLGSIIQSAYAQSVRIKGVVRDAKKQEPLEFVHVVLQRPDSAFVTGVTSDADGRFVISSVAPGDYRLAVSGLGYKNRYLPVEIRDKDLTLEEAILLEDEAIALENVTVSASNQSSRIDKKIIYPSERQVNASTNGVDLLQQLMLPKLQVNPIFNEVSLPGGGELQYRINGVKVEAQDIIALRPADIIRLEFHDNPGLRYGNAEVVLDYIVRRPETGGSAGFSSNNSPTVAWGNNDLNVKVNHKKSEFGVNYSVSHRDFYKMWRDNEEAFTFADGSSLTRKEAGEPGHGELYWQWLNGTYSYQDEQKMFSATMRYYGRNNPHWDYKGSLYNRDDPADVVYMTDRSANTSHR
ncbi:MAG: carboxypeptidase-like regulatory domain-containing protein, partial [Tannerellaceae bacterium]|nr:carboxypeptidase-like regulatory domain-containing protein [Tannerellaceae bacterium]